MSVSNPLDSVHSAHYMLVLIKQTSCHICASTQDEVFRITTGSSEVPLWLMLA